MACNPKTYQGLVQSHEVALSNPIVQIDSILFKEQANITILPVYQGSQIRYTTDGSEVQIDSPLCPTLLVFNESTNLKCKAFHTNFKASETIDFAIRKTSTIQPQILINDVQAKSPYQGKGISALSNAKKGAINFKANQEWLGFQNEVITFELFFEEETTCQQITLSTLCDHHSWIFNPSKIELVVDEKIIASHSIEMPKESQEADFQFLALPVAASLKEASLHIYMNYIPDWHSGKGTTPWFFIDEIIVE